MESANQRDASSLRFLHWLPARPMLHSWFAAAAVGAAILLIAPHPVRSSNVDQILKAWERSSHRAGGAQCNFTRMTYDPGILPPGPDGHDRPISITKGEMAFAAPSKWLFAETEVHSLEINARTQKQEVVTHSHGEHWIGDGKSLFHVDDDKRTTEETPLPQELQGRFPVTVSLGFLWWHKSIQMPPCSFGFIVKADDLKARFHVRTITPPADEADVWLELTPIFMRDAADFVKAEVILRRPDMRLWAVRIFPTTNGENEVFLLEPSTSKQFDSSSPDAFAPPAGYKRISMHPQSVAAAKP